MYIHMCIHKRERERICVFDAVGVGECCRESARKSSLILSIHV